MKKNIAYKTLVCVESSQLFEKNNFYYCFADEGYDFWIHAPWLEQTLGVVQIKVSGDCREQFITKDQFRRPKVLPR